MPGFLLPVYDLINDSSLLGRGFAEINASGFNAFMTHKVSEESDVVAAFQEALCKAVTEGVRVYNHRVNTIPDCQLFQLPRDPSGGDSIPIFVQKNEAAFLVLIVQPRKGFILQSFGYVYSPEFSTLRIQIQMPQLDVFHLDLYELADPCAGCGQKAYYKIPEQLVIPLEAGIKILIVGLADDIFQKGFLLHSHKRHYPALFADALQVAVDCP